MNRNWARAGGAGAVDLKLRRTVHNQISCRSGEGHGRLGPLLAELSRFHPTEGNLHNEEEEAFKCANSRWENSFGSLEITRK